jgi:branched-chain amino acid transport system ATP-binding protein
MLELNNIHTSYGSILVLKGINLKVERGNIVAFLGPNGAGKSTTLKTISGLVRPTQGSIAFEGKTIHRVPAREIVKLGITQVPERRELFSQMTVLENLELGAYVRKDSKEIRKDLEMVYGYFPILLERHFQDAGTLSGGEQQMLAIGRALMARPKLALFDEPSLGLAPLLVEEIFLIIQKINEDGTTVLLVEQNARVALEIAQYGYIIETGKIVLEDNSKGLVNNDLVRKYYLGIKV